MCSTRHVTSYECIPQNEEIMCFKHTQIETWHALFAFVLVVVLIEHWVGTRGVHQSWDSVESNRNSAASLVTAWSGQC